MGGFKINGSPKMGKGPMSNEEDKKSSNKASLSQPTQAGRVELCTELISKAMRCLGNGDKDCVIKMIEELIKANCHNGHAVGKEVADKVRELIHEMWLVSDNECRCELLRMLKSLDVSRNWVRDALGMSTKTLNMWLVRCGIDWEGRATRNDVVRQLEDLLRRMGWSEVRMCEELWQFVGVDVETFRMYGVEPCIWLNGLEELSNLRNPYWLGLKASDLIVWKYNRGVRLELKTTNTIDAVFFVKILSTIKTPSLKIKWERVIPAAKYMSSKSINLLLYIDINVDKWPWPELSANELKRVLEGFTDEEMAMFVSGLLDGDGTVRYEFKNDYVAVLISACKACPKSFILDVLKEVIAKRFGIIGSTYFTEKEKMLVFSSEDAVRLLRRIVKYVHHPLRRLRAELILALYDGRISPEELEELYKMIKYERGRDDVKRNRGLEVLMRAAPQTHTHGVIKINTN
jgi:hypothetical protein